jgi:hypothetical protein
MISCRICDKNIANENASKHMTEHEKKGEIPHSREETTSDNNN